jgi:hypothetical protein
VSFTHGFPIIISGSTLILSGSFIGKFWSKSADPAKASAGPNAPEATRATPPFSSASWFGVQTEHNWLRAPLGEKAARDRPELASGLGAVIPFFAYSREIRKIIHTTNAIESLHTQTKRWTSCVILRRKSQIFLSCSSVDVMGQRPGEWKS